MAAQAQADGNPQRLDFVQWIRVFLICLVVAQHSAEPYVVTGGDWLINDPASSEVLLVLFVLSGTYFMGFFFLISGYFLDASIDRHGITAVARSRLVRLGIPLIFFVIFVNGAIGYLVYGKDLGLVGYLQVYLLGGRAEFGPLWFTAHLLIYILAYLALRAVFAGGSTRSAVTPKPPGHIAILAYVLVLGGVTALVRSVYPIDDWVRFFWFIPGEPARLPQYVSLFAIGILAGRGQWFTKIDDRVAVVWFAIGAAVFAVFAALALDRLAVPDDIGLRITWGFFEAFVSVGMILGILVFFRRFVSHSGTWLRRLEGNVYGVYLVHIYVVLGLQAAMLSAGLPALAKFCVVAATSLVLSFIVVGLLRRAQAVRRII